MDFTAKEITDWLMCNASDDLPVRDSQFHEFMDFGDLSSSELIVLLIDGPRDHLALVRHYLRERITNDLYQLDVLNSNEL